MSLPTRRSSFLALLLAALLVGTGLVPVVASPAQAVTLGAGSYTETPPAGAAVPGGCGDLATNPRQFVTTDAPTGAVPTNDWWSSILFKKTDCSFGEPLYAHPAAYDTYPGGLGIGYPTTPTLSATEYHYAYQRDLLVGVTGLSASQVLVDDWTEWTVSPLWTDGTRRLRATIGHGLPLAWFDATGGAARLEADAPLSVWHNSGATLGLTVRGHDYVAFAPAGSTWTVAGPVATSDLGGRGYFTVGVLPTTTATTAAERDHLLAQFGAVAHHEVTGTRVGYHYDEASALLETTYTLTTTAREGSGTGAVVALYPHQWRALSGDTPIVATYTSPRGRMKVLTGSDGFTTRRHFTGVLPELPAVATSSGADLSALKGYLGQVADDPSGQQRTDTYWAGKGLGRAARVAEIADLVGEASTRDTALGAIRSTLQDWFTADGADDDALFTYNRAWGTLIGYPASYGSDTELNDHHFHYGYFIAAAATLARFDPGWADRFGGMVDLLIRDAADADRTDTRFPFLRDFDIYAGHDWASGHGSFAAGNNQESSSEGMNFAGALVEWGEATGDTAVRDTGIYLYTTQADAIDEYWFDTAGSTFPDGFGFSRVGMVWGDGGAHATWFSGEPETIHGINQLPITGSHLYLGRHPDDVVAGYRALVAENGGQPTVWQDIAWEALALGDPDAALAHFRAEPGYTPEEGETRAHTFHWLRNLAALGTMDATVWADHPLAAVFTNQGRRTYVAANPTTAGLTVTFSDGTRLSVGAGRTATTGAITWQGGGATGTAPSPTPTPTPTPTATATPSATAAPTSGASPTATPATLHLRADGRLGASAAAALATVPAARGRYDGDPHDPVTFTATGVTGALRGTTAFDLAVDAGTQVGAAVQVRLSYDLTGDGAWERVETYRYFATDPVVGTERYRQDAGLLQATGTLGDFRGGSVRLEVWNALGSEDTVLVIGDASTVTLPIG